MATLEDLEARVAALEGRDRARGRFRSLDDQLAGIKDLIIGRRNGV